MADGCMHAWMDGWMDGWIDRQMNGFGPWEHKVTGNLGTGCRMFTWQMTTVIFIRHVS